MSEEQPLRDTATTDDTVADDTDLVGQDEALPSNYKVFIYAYILLAIILAILIGSGSAPLSIIYVFLVQYLICGLGWELWLSFGLIGGGIPPKARSNTLKQKLFGLVFNTTGDAFIGVIQVLITYYSGIKCSNCSNNWDWCQFLLIFSIGRYQDWVYAAFLFHNKNTRLSWAPLHPIPFSWWGYTFVQTQQSWTLQPLILYPIVRNLNILDS